MTCRRAGSSSATVPSGSGSELKTSTCSTALATTTGTIRRGGRPSGNDSSASGMNSATDHGHAAEYAVAQPRAGAPVARRLEQPRRDRRRGRLADARAQQQPAQPVVRPVARDQPAAEAAAQADDRVRHDEAVDGGRGAHAGGRPARPRPPAPPRSRRRTAPTPRPVSSRAHPAVPGIPVSAPVLPGRSSRSVALSAGNPARRRSAANRSADQEEPCPAHPSRNARPPPSPRPSPGV